MTHMVMLLAPYGVFALMAWVAGKPMAWTSCLPLAMVIIGVYLACILHVLLTLTGGGIMLFARLNPVRYLRGIIDAQAVAFTTTSSSGTLPVTISCARENLGVSKGVSSFVLPLGATINMDGTALYQGVAALFVAQAFGVDLGTGDYITIILTSTLASIGTAKPAAQRTYELADGTEVRMDVAGAEMELLGEFTSGLVIFGEANVEPLLV